jgi:hypothetical protein
MHSVSFSVSKVVNGLTVLIVKHSALNLGTCYIYDFSMRASYQFLFQKLHIGYMRYYFIIINNIQISKRIFLC